MRSISNDTLRQLARMDLSPVWDVRLVDQNGAVYPIPPGAIKGRQRGTELDGSAWRLSLSLDRALLPRGTDPKQYHKLEMDLLIGSDVIPYFRGIIDHPQSGESLQGGAITEPLSLEALGMLQKTKGYRVNSFRVDPAWVSAGVSLLMGYCTVDTLAPGSVKLAGEKDILTSVGTCGAADGFLEIYSTSSYATQYVEGIDYTLNTTKAPIEITWINPPATTRVIVWFNVERFARPIWSSVYATIPNFYFCKPGRRIDDLYQTYVTAIDAPNKRVTVSDPTGYDSLLDLAQGEYVAFSIGGVDSCRKVASFNSGTSELTIDAAETLPAGLAVGDGIRLVTTEHFQAWDDDRLLRFFTSSAGVTEWNRTYLMALPNVGHAIPIKPRDWAATEEVWADLYYVDQTGAQNRVENIIKLFLVGTGLFSASDITIENTGAYVKNFTFTAQDADQILATLAPNSIPPNAFIHDEPDGTVSIKPYRQKTDPDWTMRGVHEIQESDQPEPISAVTVIAESDKEINLAPRLFSSSANFTSPERCIDGDKSSSATPTASTSAATLTFRIPRATPLTAFPVIDKIRIQGQGLLTVYVTRSGTDYYLAGHTFEPLKSGSLEISGEELHRVLLVASTLESQDLTFRFDPVTSGDNLSTVTVLAGGEASVSEIEILTTQAGAWKAEITDDTAKSPADNGADQRGSTWTQGDAALRESWRYAPAEYLKRVSARYYAPGSGTANKPRHKILKLKGISQQAARDYAEKWLDYSLMEGKSYTVSGILDPRAQLGDTVRIFRKDGSYLDLFLWGISDGGEAGDLSCTYQLRDYR